jgi:hypothetical protein
MLSYEILTPDPVFMMHDVEMLMYCAVLFVACWLPITCLLILCSLLRSVLSRLPCAATAAVDQTGKTHHKPKKAGCPPEWTLLSPLGCVLYETS